jgi:Uma2 family endonuclease
MGMPDTLSPVYWTADMARRLPDDGNRYEVVYGELLVTPAPRLWHQQLVGRIHLALGNYLEIHRAGVVLTAPADISWGQDVLVQPDVFVVPVDQARALEWSAIRDLLLVVEVHGEGAQVEVWTPDDVFPRIERERLTWRPAGAGGAFMLPLGELFRPIE